MRALPTLDFAFNPDDLDPIASVIEQEAVWNEAPPADANYYQVHTQKGHLVYAIGGSTVCHTRDAVFTVLPNHAFWVPEGVQHKFFHSPGASSGYLFLTKNYHSKLPRTCCSVYLPEYLLAGFRHLAESDPITGFTERQKRLFQVLYEELCYQSVRPLISLPLPKDRRLRQVAFELMNDPGAKKTQEEWAESVFMSGRTFARLLKRETAMTFLQWKTQIQLDAAIQMLPGSEPINLIAYQLGYSSPSAFSAMFRRQMHVTPQEYRDSCRQRG